MRLTVDVGTTFTFPLACSLDRFIAEFVGLQVVGSNASLNGDDDVTELTDSKSDGFIGTESTFSIPLVGAEETTGAFVGTGGGSWRDSCVLMDGCGSSGK